ncbi:MAG: hypothetical protein ACSHYB_15145 [Roseibacillus sp.]
MDLMPQKFVSSISHLKAPLLGSFLTSLWPLSAQADGLLLDFNDGQAWFNLNAEATVESFKAAGVVEPLDNLQVTAVTAEGARFEEFSSVSATDSPIVVSFSTPPGVFSTPEAFNNDLLDDYLYLRNNDSSTITIAGLSPLLTPEKEYFLYLFGYGDISGQDSRFGYGPIRSQYFQSPVSDQDPDQSPGVALDRFCKFRFTTGSTVDDSLSIRWSFGPHSHSSGISTAAFNGLAIVPVPEESVAIDCLQISQIEPVMTGGYQFLLTWPSEEGERYFIDYITNTRLRPRFKNQETAHYADGPITRRLVYSENLGEIMRVVNGLNP